MHLELLIAVVVALEVVIQKALARHVQTHMVTLVKWIVNYSALAKLLLMLG